jgi:ACDE family multidrug resistance protein
MGTMSMITGIGAVSAPLIGGILASYAWNVPFLFYGLSIQLAIIVAFALPETNSHENRSKDKQSIIKALAEFRILYTIILSFSIFFLLYTMVIYVPFILKDNYGFTSIQAGLALGVEGIAMAGISSRARSLSARFGKRKLLMAGFGMTGLSLGGLIFASSLNQILALLLVFGAGFGMVQPQLNTLATQVAPPGMMGGIVSVFNIMKYAGQTAAPLLLAVVLFHSDIQIVFATSCKFAFVVAFSTYSSKDIYERLDG